MGRLGMMVGVGRRGRLEGGFLSLVKIGGAG
jgi:hypothetical protein